MYMIIDWFLPERCLHSEDRSGNETRRRGQAIRNSDLLSPFQNNSDRYERENQRLLEKIAENGKDPDRRGTGNVLLIGKSGSGKSALISSIYTSVTGSYRQVVKSGSGEAQSVSLSLNHVRKCGIRDYDIMNHPNVTQLREVVESVPNIFDFAGLGNINTPALKEILQAVIHGYIRPGTSYEQMEAFQQRYGVGKLRNMFRYPKKEWKVTKIVFVQSCQETVADKLIDCLNEVLREVDPWTFKQKYRGSIFIVISKIDEAPRGSIASSVVKQFRNQDDSDNDVEKQLARKFNFGGNLEFNRLWLTNYSEKTGYKYTPEIANMHLQLLFHLTLRGANDDADDDVFEMSAMKYLYLELMLFIDTLSQPFQGQMSKSFAVGIVIAAIFMYIIITQIVPKLSI